MVDCPKGGTKYLTCDDVYYCDCDDVDKDGACPCESGGTVDEEVEI